MGEIQAVRPALRIMAVTCSMPEGLAWAIDRAQREWGTVALASSVFPFDQTTYYEAEMGRGLQKQLVALDRLMDPGELPESKLTSNAWEDEYRQLAAADVSRPLNMDPGYLTEAKLVLATTKDREHRVYLGKGIFAEITVAYKRKAWQCFDWTYPDFRQPAYLDFWTRCREYLRSRLADIP